MPLAAPSLLTVLISVCAHLSGSGERSTAQRTLDHLTASFHRGDVRHRSIGALHACLILFVCRVRPGRVLLGLLCPSLSGGLPDSLRSI